LRRPRFSSVSMRVPVRRRFTTVSVASFCAPGKRREWSLPARIGALSFMVWSPTTSTHARRRTCPRQPIERTICRACRRPATSPNVDFQLSDAQRELRALAAEVADREFKPRASRWDENEEFPEECLKILGKNGFTAVTVPEQYGGLGLGD